MNKISPVSAAAAAPIEATVSASTKRTLAKSARGVSETVNAEANARATAARFRALSPSQNGVGTALDLVG